MVEQNEAWVPDSSLHCWLPPCRLLADEKIQASVRHCTLGFSKLWPNVLVGDTISQTPFITVVLVLHD